MILFFVFVFTGNIFFCFNHVCEGGWVGGLKGKCNRQVTTAERAKWFKGKKEQGPARRLAEKETTDTRLHTDKSIFMTSSRVAADGKKQQKGSYVKALPHPPSPIPPVPRYYKIERRCIM
jgi:hypothetical protein